MTRSEPITDRFVAGQRVWYVLSPLRKGAPTRYMPVMVDWISARRVVILPLSGGKHRSVLPFSLTDQPPPPGALIIGNERID